MSTEYNTEDLLFHIYFVPSHQQRTGASYKSRRWWEVFQRGWAVVVPRPPPSPVKVKVRSITAVAQLCTRSSSFTACSYEVCTWKLYVELAATKRSYGTAVQMDPCSRRLNQTPGFLNAKLLGKFPGPVFGVKTKRRKSTTSASRSGRRNHTHTQTNQQIALPSFFWEPP